MVNPGCPLVILMASAKCSSAVIVLILRWWDSNGKGYTRAFGTFRSDLAP
jgi:hypothetical protein